MTAVKTYCSENYQEEHHNANTAHIRNYSSMYLSNSAF